MRKALLLCLALAVLPGCAALRTSIDSSAEVDTQKVFLVEQWARRNSVNVYWFNLPTRAAPATAAPATRAPAARDG